MADTNSPALILPASPPATNALAGEDIRGLKPLVPIPNSYLWIAWVAGAVLLLLAAWWIWKKWGRKLAAPKPVPQAPPHRRAKDKLRNARELLSDPYVFCSLVSDVLRVYIEERFDLHAPERTTEEFLEELRYSTRLHPDHKELLEHFLTRCDLVKFARHEPSQEELLALLDSALRLIDETAPVPVEDNQTAGAQTPTTP